MAIDILSLMKNVFGSITDYPLILLLGAAGLYLLVFFLYGVLFGPGKGKNPFNKDHRRPHEPFVHDAKARDAVIKQKFKPAKVPDDLDVIVIGSGVGGLTAGVLLSRAGKKVLVLEQHDQAGGCCHSFVEKGFEFDTGIHYVGDMQEDKAERALVDSITEGQLRWAEMDDAYDTVALGDPANAKRYPMKSGKERYTQNLIDMFPHEKDAINKYMDLILDAAKGFEGIVLLKTLPKCIVKFLVTSGLYKLLFKCYRKGYTHRTLQEVLDELTSDKDLKAVLSYVFGDCGVLPDEVPFIMHAVIINHYLAGAYYPVAGTSEIAFHTVRVIEKLGGRVLVQAHVNEILCNEAGRTIGVSVGKEETKIYARSIISDAGVANTFKTLLPQKVAQKSCIYPLIDKVGPSISFITTFIGVDGSPEELKLPAGNTWAFSSNDLNKAMGDFLNTKTDDIEDARVPLSYISFPSAKDPEWSNKYPGKSSVLVITLAKWQWFKDWKEEKLRHRGDRYDAIKDVIGRNMWQTCTELFPQLDGKMVYMEVGTPVTNQHYLACPEGEMYGLNQGKLRFDINAVTNLRGDTDVPGLYLTGQDMMTGGFTSALLMGLVTACHVLNRNLYNDLLALHKKLQSQNGVRKDGQDKKID